MENSNNNPQSEQCNLHIVMPRFLCFLFGHKKPVPMLNETEWAIFTKGCPRCGTHLGMPATWKNCPPPPNSNEEQLKSWEEFKLKHYAEVEMLRFLGEDPNNLKKLYGDHFYIDKNKVEGGLVIKTLEGEHIATIGDFIIKGVHGEYYPCKPDIFEKTYESVEEDTTKIDIENVRLWDESGCYNYDI